MSGAGYDPVYKQYAEYLGQDVTWEHIDEDPMLGYYFYVGSSTKPGCDENVYWYVFREVLPVSSGTLSVISRLVEITYGSTGYENARDVQDSMSNEDRDIRLEGCNPLYGVNFSPVSIKGDD